MRLISKRILGVAMSTIAISTLCLSCVAQPSGQSQFITRQYNFNDFSNVEIGGPFAGLDANILQSDSYAVSINMPQDMEKSLEITNSMKTLKIVANAITFGGERPVVTIKMPDLQSADFSGGSRGKVAGFKLSHDLRIATSGGGSLELDVQVGKIDMTVSGGGHLIGHIIFTDATLTATGGSGVELTGHGDNLTVLDASGGSQIRLADFPVTSADITMSGGSQADISVTDNLSVNLSGGSAVHYKGNPNITKQILTGFSELTQD